MLDKVRIRNFRCLRDVEVPLGPLNFLIGPNNTGKSSFLHAIDVLCRCASDEDVSKAFASREGGDRPLERADERFERAVTNGQCNRRIEYGCDLSWAGEDQNPRAVHYELGVALDPPRPGGTRRVVIARELLRFDRADGSDEVVLQRPVDPALGALVELPSGKSVPAKELGTGRTIVGRASREGELPIHLTRCLRSTPAYGLVPERMAQLCNVSPPRLAADGFGLASLLDAFADSAPERFETIHEALRRFVPGLKYVTFPTVAERQKTILFHEDWGAKVYASEASGGLLLFLAYLSLAYVPDDVGILLVEEPEMGVHPHRLRDIVHILRAISRGELGLPPVQVIATSHSPYLVDWCSKEEVVHFGRDDTGNVRTKPLVDVPDIDDRIEDFESLGAWLYSVGEQVCESGS